LAWKKFTIDFGTRWHTGSFELLLRLNRLSGHTPISIPIDAIVSAVILTSSESSGCRRFNSQIESGPPDFSGLPR